MLLPQKIEHLYDFAQCYKVIFCDIWGVVHNGITPYPLAVEILRKLRQMGKKVVLITNSPRFSKDVALQLQNIGVSEDCYDFIVTSGDATAKLLEQAPRRIFYIGSERDLNLLDYFDLEQTELNEAQAILCTSIDSELVMQPKEILWQYYEPILRQARSRNLPFICGNPDIQVWRGDKLLYCAGFLAQFYAKMGGRCQIAGKPHNIIYDLACKLVAESAKDIVEKKHILAIGDGLLTDIQGANNYNVDNILILDGVNKEDFMQDGVISDSLVQAYLSEIGIMPTAYMSKLK